MLLIFKTIIAPTIVGIVITIFSSWWNKKKK